MALPTVALPTATVAIDGTDVPVRGLTRGEAMRIANGMGGDPMEMEIQTLAYGLDTELEEVRDWYQKAPSSVVQPLSEKIMELSGLDGLGNVLRGA